MTQEYSVVVASPPPETVMVATADMKRLHDALVRGDVNEAYDALYWAAQNQPNAQPFAPFAHWFGAGAI